TGARTPGDGYNVGGGDFCENDSRLLVPPYLDSNNNLVTLWRNYDFFLGEIIIALRVYNAMGTMTETKLVDGAVENIYNANAYAVPGGDGATLVARSRQGGSINDVDVVWIENNLTVSMPLTLKTWPS